jgi:signal transduction histidine kinase
VKNPNIPRTRSSGLGLAFCKLAIDAHGGRIWVQSAGEGKGSAFHFSLPKKPLHREVRVTSSGAVPA